MAEPAAEVTKEIPEQKGPTKRDSSIKIPKLMRVFPVFGPMHDPETGVTYGETGVEVQALDRWVQSQVDAGKLRVE